MSVRESHARALSLILALSVVVGAWLVFEYSNRASISPVQETVPSDRANSSERGDSAVEEITEVPVRSSNEQREVNLTFKCQKNGRTSFSDKPCDADARTMSVTAAEKQPNVPDDTLAQMQRGVARMEADRLTREREQAAVIVSRASASGPDKAAECRLIDDGVALVDGLLRQPHNAKTGDDLTAERKRLMDRRFELRC